MYSSLVSIVRRVDSSFILLPFYRARRPLSFVLAPCFTILQENSSPIRRVVQRQKSVKRLFCLTACAYILRVQPVVNHPVGTRVSRLFTVDREISDGLYVFGGFALPVAHGRT